MAAQVVKTPIVARIKTGEDTFVDGLLTETDGQQAVVEFQASEAPALPIAGKTVVSIVGGGPAKIVAARVIARSDDRVRCYYRFESIEEDAFVQATVVNLRQAVRVQPANRETIEVILRGEGRGRPTRVTLIDISRSGLGVQLQTKGEDSLHRERKVRLAFRLPGDDEAFRLVGHIRQRSLFGSAIRYGIEFVQDQVTNFEREEERINRYVMKRQVEMLRAARESTEKSD